MTGSPRAEPESHGPRKRSSSMAGKRTVEPTGFARDLTDAATIPDGPPDPYADVFYLAVRHGTDAARAHIERENLSGIDAAERNVARAERRVAETLAERLARGEGTVSARSESLSQKKPKEPSKGAELDRE